jgi:thioredoxin 1
MPVTKIESAQHFIALMNTPSKLLVVDGSATWCGPCKMLSPIVAALSEEYADSVFVEVDVDELPELAEQWV